MSNFFIFCLKKIREISELFSNFYNEILYEKTSFKHDSFQSELLIPLIIFTKRHFDFQINFFFPRTRPISAGIRLKLLQNIAQLDKTPHGKSEW